MGYGVKNKQYKRNFLITCAGGSVLTAILPQFSDFKFDQIILTDINSDAAINKLIKYNDKIIFEKNTGPSGMGYYDEIRNMVQKYDIQYGIPGADEEVLYFANLYNDKVFEDIVAPKNIEFIKMCLDKNELNKKLLEDGFGAPEMNLKEKMQIIAKPKKGHGSKGLFKMENKKELKKYLDVGLINPEEYVLQEKVEGEEYTISVIPVGEDEVLVIPKHVLIKRGVTISAYTENSPEIVTLCKELNRQYRPNGPFNVQLIMDKRDLRPKIFEINPRLSTTTILTYMSGINEIGISLNLSKNKKMKFKENIFLYRFYDQIFSEGENLEEKSVGLWKKWFFRE